MSAIVNIESCECGGNGLLSKTTMLTDAQIKSLPNIGVAILPAPGAGKLCVPTLITLELTWVANYTNINGACTLDVFTDNGGFGALAPLDQATGSQISQLLALGSSSFCTMQIPLQNVGNDPAGGIANDVTLLRADNSGSGLFTGGNAGNSLRVVVYYIEVDV